MFIDVADLSNSPKHISVRIPADEIGLDEDNVRLINEVEFAADAVRNEAEIDVKGRISYKAEIDCTRCLNPIAHDGKIEFDINYVTPEHFGLEKEHEIQGTDLETDVLEGDRIDVRQVVREQVLLDLPEQIFCREDCKGICPKCGADRNLIDCKCEEDEIDPRWAALKDLK
jgi:uncharacterized protein